jgi:SSS family solute:Na+ symporter
MDIVTKLKPDISGRQQVIAGNIAGVVIISIAALWAPQIGKFDSIVKYFQELLSYMTPPVVAVFVLGIFWRRANRHGAFAGLISGFVLAVVLLLLGDRSPLQRVHFLYVAPVVFSISAAVIVVVSLLTKAEDYSKIKRYIWSVSIFREETEELKGVPWYMNFRILSILLVAATIIFMIIWR